MNPGRWDEIIALFERALERPPAERDAWLDDVTTTDPELRAEVAAMLHADAHAHPLFDAAPADLAAAFADVPAAPPFETSQIGPYTLLHEIGRGGMGAVFLAERADVQKRVAVKVVAGGRSSAEHVERFLFERRVLAQLEHPGIARLLDAGIATDGTPWLAMEYVDGDPIDAWCDAHRATITERLQLFALVCDAVACAHRNLVVHRDLKPGNILVDATGQPRLVDFGIAKVLDDTAAASPLTRGTAHPLTPRYASPEQLAGRPLTTASDVYQLGLLLHELLTGRQPRTRAGRVHEAADSLQGEEPLPASQTCASDEPAAAVVAAARATTSQRLTRALEGDLDAIVSMALRPEPERRYASALQMAEDIRRHVRGEPVAAGPDTTRYRLGKFARRNRIAVLAVAALIVALVGGSAGMAWQARRATRAAATAALERDRAAVEAAKAQEVAAFLTELFRASEPQRALGREESARDVLDRGARRLSEDGELHDQPLVRAHLLHVLGGVYLRLGWTVEARALYEQAVALRRSHAATTPAELAESLHGLATVELNEARPRRGATAVRRGTRDPAARARPGAPGGGHRALLARSRAHRQQRPGHGRDDVAQRARHTAAPRGQRMGGACGYAQWSRHRAVTTRRIPRGRLRSDGGPRSLSRPPRPAPPRSRACAQQRRRYPAAQR
jgi:eukaryotic-like serine/threonine-protein kinase